MICPNCHEELMEGAMFCANCGTKIEAPAPVEEAPAAEPAAVPVVETVTEEVVAAPVEETPAAPVKPAKPVKAPKAPKAPKEPKKHFCQKCGGEIDPKTKRCALCGKKRSTVKVWLPMLLMGLALVGVLAYGIYLFLTCDAAMKIIDSQKEEISYLHTCMDESLELRNEEVDELQAKVDELQASNDYLNEYIESMSGDFNDMTEELEFFEENAVIIFEDDQIYHRYGCIDIGTKSYYIMNSNLADYEGYDPCPDCIG